MTTGGGSGQLGTFGPYQVLGLVGSGAMGHVYRAIGPDDAHVALKVMRAEVSKDETYRRRFELEARIARQIHHPNVVRVLDAGTRDGATFMVQEFVDGTSLQQHLDERGALELSEAVRIVGEVAAGLDAIAAMGVVHRDLKPGNIMLDRTLRARVTDLGLAKDLEGPALTQPGTTLGSMDYMAPEQIRGETLSPATDVYALGCLAYACLAGQPPFGDRQAMRVMLAHLEDTPSDLGAIRPDLPAGVVATIAAALAKDPVERPPSAGEMAAALRSAAAK